MTPDPSPPRELSPAAVLAAVVEVTREAIDASTEAAVADAVLRVASALIGADQGTLGIVRDGEVITVAALMPPRQPVGSHFPVGFGVAGWVAATGQAAEIPDVRQDRRYVALPYPEVRSFVGLPLVVNGDMLGVLSLAAWRPGAFAPRTAESLAPFAEHAALLLRHAAADGVLHQRLKTIDSAAQESLAESLHELKSPLHAAAGFLELVADEQVGPLNDQQKDFLDTARGECARLKHALATLVEVGALSAQRAPSFDVIEAAELVRTSVERFRGQALTRRVQLVESVDPRARPVRVDRAAILQVLANFLQNALRVAPPDSEILVSASADHGQTCFSVADRGPGLPDGNVERLFQRFGQGDGHDRRAGDVGLGLSLSRRIVEQHQGTIWAENRPDGGSLFAFALPT